MLGGSVIKVVSSCKINYFGHFSTIIEDFDWTNTVGEVKGSFFSWSFLPWWPKSTKSHDLVFENSITGATGARNFFVHVNLPKPISVRSNRISFKEWGLFLTMPPPKKYFWALRRAVPWFKSRSCHRFIPFNIRLADTFLEKLKLPNCANIYVWFIPIPSFWLICIATL